MANRQSISDFEVMNFELKPLCPIQLGLTDLLMLSIYARNLKFRLLCIISVQR